MGERRRERRFIEINELIRSMKSKVRRSGIKVIEETRNRLRTKKFKIMKNTIEKIRRVKNNFIGREGRKKKENFDNLTKNISNTTSVIMSSNKIRLRNSSIKFV